MLEEEQNVLTHWNYRIIRHERNGETFYQIHEVYYRNGLPVATTLQPSTPYGENADELRGELALMLSALSKPALNYSDFGIT